MGLSHGAVAWPGRLWALQLPPSLGIKGVVKQCVAKASITPYPLLLEGMMVMMMSQSKAWPSEGSASTVQATFLCHSLLNSAIIMQTHT